MQTAWNIVKSKPGSGASYDIRSGSASGRANFFCNFCNCFRFVENNINAPKYLQGTFSEDYG